MNQFSINLPGLLLVHGTPYDIELWSVLPGEDRSCEYCCGYWLGYEPGTTHGKLAI